MRCILGHTPGHNGVAAAVVATAAQADPDHTDVFNNKAGPGLQKDRAVAPRCGTVTDVTGVTTRGERGGTTKGTGSPQNNETIRTPGKRSDHVRSEGTRRHYATHAPVRAVQRHPQPMRATCPQTTRIADRCGESRSAAEWDNHNRVLGSQELAKHRSQSTRRRGIQMRTTRCAPGGHPLISVASRMASFLGAMVTC